MEATIDGWSTLVVSDVDRDGLGVELLDRRGDTVAEVFRYDTEHCVTVTVWENVPEHIVKWLCDRAEERLGPAFPDGVPLPERRSWVSAAA